VSHTNSSFEFSIKMKAVKLHIILLQLAMTDKR